MASVHVPINCTHEAKSKSGIMRESNSLQEAGVMRPPTPSFRIVSTATMNPSPTPTCDEFEEEEVLFEDVLSPKKLGVTGVTVNHIPTGQQILDDLADFWHTNKPFVYLRTLSGYADLADVISLDLIVDTRESSLGSFGNYLPNIRELRLSGSKITTVRDLGTTLRTLEVLWMSRCGLEDLDGISSIGQLKELYLSYNEISDVSPLSMIDSLELVDIESNNVDSLEQVEFLCMCPSLTTLNLEGNPVAMAMSSSELREKIGVLLPSLLYLDDQPLKGGGNKDELTTSSHKLLGNTGNLMSEMRVVNSSLKETIAGDMTRPPSARSSRDDSSSPSPTPSASHMNLTRDHCSDLTQGAVICGPPSKLLTKMSRTARENLLNDVLDTNAEPPTLTAAWSDQPEDMLRDWQESREWLTRELTIDNIHEKSIEQEKKENYEAALRETSRATTPHSRLSRPTSSRSRTTPDSSSSSRAAVYDECIDIEEPRKRRSSGNRQQRKDRNSQSVEYNTTKRRSSVDKTLSKSMDSKIASPVRPRYKSPQLPEPRSPVERRSPAERRALVDELRPPPKPHAEMRALPTPPAQAKGMSSRFRRLKVSIEDQVAQQSTMEVLYNDKMPRPGLSRHNVSVPNRPS